MDKLGMKTVEAGLQATANAKPGAKTGEVTDDFRKLLREKGDDIRESKESQDSKNNQDSKEVSGDAKREKTDAADDTKKTGAPKDQTKSEETGKTEESVDTKQAEELLAAQMRERFSYGFIQLGQEAGETAAVEAPTAQAELPEAAASIQTAGVTGLPEVQTQETDAAQMVQTSQTEQVEELVQMVRPEQTAGQKETVSAAQGEVEVKPAETKVAAQSTSESGQETQDFSSSLRNTGKTSQTETKSQEQPEDSTAVQAESGMVASAAQIASTGTEKPVQAEEVRSQETVTTVHVEQPEELPEKVADQLLAKIAEGTKEIEIQIEPANLGKIAVKILYENNQATVSIICSEKRAMDILGQRAQEIGNIIDRNLGGETTIIVEKQETDYLNQTRDENEQAGQDARQQKEGSSGDQSKEDAEQFLQKLRLGLTG